MAVLTKKTRDALPTSDFAIPEKRAYPIQDKGHAQSAVGLVDDNGSPEEKARVRAAVKRRFGMLSAKRKEQKKK